MSRALQPIETRRLQMLDLQQRLYQAEQASASQVANAEQLQQVSGHCPSEVATLDRVLHLPCPASSRAGSMVLCVLRTSAGGLGGSMVVHGTQLHVSWTLSLRLWYNRVTSTTGHACKCLQSARRLSTPCLLNVPTAGDW